MDNIEEADEKIFQIFTDDTRKLPYQIVESNYPKSSPILLGFNAGLNSVKLGIFELCREQDIY